MPSGAIVGTLPGMDKTTQQAAQVDLAAAEERAKAATPGPWKATTYADSPSMGKFRRQSVVIVEDAVLVGYGAGPLTAEDAAHIAGMSPDVTCALDDRCRAAEAAVERLRTDNETGAALLLEMQAERDEALADGVRLRKIAEQMVSDADASVRHGWIAVVPQSVDAMRALLAKVPA